MSNELITNDVTFDELNSPFCSIYDCVVHGLRCLYTAVRVDESTVPEKLHIYHLRSCGNGRYTLEKFVGVNFGGTVLSIESIPEIDNDEKENVYIDCEEDIDIFFDENVTTIMDYLLYNNYGTFSYPDEALHVAYIGQDVEDISMVLIQPTGGLSANDEFNIVDTIHKVFSKRHYNIDIEIRLYRFDINNNKMEITDYIKRLISLLEVVDYVIIPNSGNYELEIALAKLYNVEMLDVTQKFWHDVERKVK